MNINALRNRYDNSLNPSIKNQTSKLIKAVSVGVATAAVLFSSLPWIRQAWDSPFSKLRLSKESINDSKYAITSFEISEKMHYISNKLNHLPFQPKLAEKEKALQILMSSEKIIRDFVQVNEFPKKPVHYFNTIMNNYDVSSVIYGIRALGSSVFIDKNCLPILKNLISTLNKQYGLNLKLEIETLRGSCKLYNLDHVKNIYDQHTLTKFNVDESFDNNIKIFENNEQSLYGTHIKGLCYGIDTINSAIYTTIDIFKSTSHNFFAVNAGVLDINPEEFKKLHNVLMQFPLQSVLKTIPNFDSDASSALQKFWISKNTNEQFFMFPVDLLIGSQDADISGIFVSSKAKLVIKNALHEHFLQTKTDKTYEEILTKIKYFLEKITFVNSIDKMQEPTTLPGENLLRRCFNSEACKMDLEKHTFYQELTQQLLPDAKKIIK